ncbi:hypothetical protein, partial [Serratia marcescens]|uniref:hypothetical protein n=1 Tax=Serratia marcescens TaxID=615 RepID=UPI001E332980
LGCVLANTNLNVLTAVFYWFTLKRDEPYSFPENPIPFLTQGEKPPFSLQRPIWIGCCSCVNPINLFPHRTTPALKFHTAMGRANRAYLWLNNNRPAGVKPQCDCAFIKGLTRFLM